MRENYICIKLKESVYIFENSDDVDEKEGKRDRGNLVIKMK